MASREQTTKLTVGRKLAVGNNQALARRDSEKGKEQKGSGEDKREEKGEDSEEVRGEEEKV